MVYITPNLFTCITCSVIEVLETVAVSLAVNEEITEDEQVVTVLNFEGDMSAIVVERVSVGLYRVIVEFFFDTVTFSHRTISLLSKEMVESSVQQERVKVYLIFIRHCDTHFNTAYNRYCYKVISSGN